MSRTDPRPQGPHALLLRAALLDAPRALDAWRAWRAAVDFDLLDGPSYRLVPLLWRNLERLGVRDETTGILRGIHRRTWLENHLLLRRLAGVLERLHAAGLSTLVLKGAALVGSVYDDVGSRAMADVDVLVRSKAFPLALDCLRAAGWVPEPDRLEAWEAGGAHFRARHVGIGLREAGDALSTLDLHERIFKVFAEHPVPFPEARLWEAARPHVVHGVSTRRLAPHHQLLHVLVHGVQAQDFVSYAWIPDADRLLRRYGRELAWGELLAEARAQRLLAPLREGLEFLGAEYGSPVPAPVLSALRRLRVSLVERLERPLRRGRRGAAFDASGVAAPLLRRARERGEERLTTAELVRGVNRVLVRLPIKHALQGPLGRPRGRGRRERVTVPSAVAGETSPP